MASAEEFEELRPLLRSIAYRILGSVAEAEDAVQETWLRYAAADVEPESLRAYLTTIVTRVSINVLRSARVRREAYPGPWFPEPVLDDPYEDPERAAELADSISMATLLLLERLTPLERAVFVLREVFGFDFAHIAEAVERSESAVRQLAVRARRHMDAGRTRFDVDAQARDRLAARFFAAFRKGDVDALRETLRADAQLVGDAGGKAPSLPRAVVGADRIARVLAGFGARAAAIGLGYEEVVINGQPGMLARERDGAVLHVVVLDVAEGGVQTVRTIINPEKLRHLGPVADAWAVSERYRAASGRRQSS